MSRPHRVVIVAFEQAELLDIGGPADCLATANIANAGVTGSVYDIVVASPSGGLVKTSSGISLQTRRLGAVRPDRVDTLIVAGGLPAVSAASGDGLVKQVARLCRHAERVTSVCTGAFVLAATGLVDGRRLTTHWRFCSQLQQYYPQVRVEPDAIYVNDGRYWSSAGVTAGIDLSLALIEQDHGARIAGEVARDIVVYLRRSGGQSQFSTVLDAERTDADGRFTELLRWIVGHPAANLSVERLAERAGMSARTFARRFRAATGDTPAKFVEKIRLDAARSLLETSDKSIEDIARGCGFVRAETLRRSFQRVLGVTPAAYRAHHGHLSSKTNR